MNWRDYIPLFIIGFFIVLVVVAYFSPNARRGIQIGRARREKENREKQEALFKVTFPELQPYLHPEEVLQFVNSWRKRPAESGAFEWRNPPGFASMTARFGPSAEKGQPVEILDSAGCVVSQWLLQDHPEGGAIRLGPGKLTANVENETVRYWHPEREFKWSRLKGFRMITSLADRGIVSTDQGTYYSSSDRSYSPSTATTAAPMTGAGGTFDGGGASQSWDEPASSRTSY